MIYLACMLFLDVVVLSVIMHFIKREKVSEFGRLDPLSVGVGFVNAVLFISLGGALGALVLVPVLIVDGAIIKFAFGLTWRLAGIATGLFAICKVLQVIAPSML
jgi:hypothetical protein